MNNESKGNIMESNPLETPKAARAFICNENYTRTTTTVTTLRGAIRSEDRMQQNELEHMPHVSVHDDGCKEHMLEEKIEKRIDKKNGEKSLKCWAQIPSVSRTKEIRVKGSTDECDAITTNIPIEKKKSDKSVSTHDRTTLEDLQRALTYEAIFNSLLEQKMLAMKRDCEDHKRLKRNKRKSLGRILFSKKLFSCRKSTSRLESQSLDANNEWMLVTKQGPDDSISGRKTTANRIVGRCHTVDEIEPLSPASSSTSDHLRHRAGGKRSSKPLLSAVVTATIPEKREGSVAISTVSNSSDKQLVHRNVIVRAQTHTVGRPSETVLTSSSSGDSKELAQNAQQLSSITNEKSSLRTNFDTMSLASGDGNGGDDKLHTSTMADDSLTSLRDSIESLSFASSSRCTVSFGATEIIPEDASSLLYERGLRAAKRLRILEAKSISAQCSPIFQRHVGILPTVNLTTIVPMAPSNLIYALPPITTSPATSMSIRSSTAKYPAAATESTVKLVSAIRPNKNSIGTQTIQTTPYLPQQLSYTDSMYGYMTDKEVSAGYSRNISRQNTSEDSANVTMSTFLNQSDSLSLQTPAFFGSSTFAGTLDSKGIMGRSCLAVNDRVKSRSASLLMFTNSNKQPRKTLNTHPKILATTDPVDRIDNKILPPLSTKLINTRALSANIDTISPSNLMISDLAKLNHMTSTSTGSSIAPPGCCTTMTSSFREKGNQRVIKSNMFASGQSGSDDEYHKRKRKYKRYHRCSDPVLVYPTPSGLQHCMISMPTSENRQFQYVDNFTNDVAIGVQSNKTDEFQQIISNRKHRHHRHKKRRRHKKSKILVQDLEKQAVKIRDPDDLPQRARWTIIATACLLLLMCLMLVGITLRMAPIIDDMGEFHKNWEHIYI